MDDPDRRHADLHSMPVGACLAASDADDLAETLYLQRMADKEWME